MTLKAERVETCAASINDQPGSLAGKLGALAKAGANLEFVIARRTPEKPGKGVVFVAPLKGAKARHAGGKAGFTKATSLHTVRVEGPDRRGQGVRIAQALADQGLNLRGLSAAAIGKKFVAYLALDSALDAAKAVRIIRGL
jgi:hypothetical protein